MKTLDNGNVLWICPKCGKEEEIDSWEANVIYNSRLETKYICKECMEKENEK